MPLQNLDDLLAHLSENPQYQDIVSEIQVLQSIYGDHAIRLWPQDEEADISAPGDTIRLRVDLNLASPFEDIPLAVLVSLPPSYPENSPPQLQLLTRYVGDIAADSELFGVVLRTFISVKGVDWVPGTVCVFDGLQSALDECTAWYQEKLSENEARRQIQALEQENSLSGGDTHLPARNVPAMQPPTGRSVSAEMLSPSLSITMVEAEAIVDRKSSFVGRACRISTPSEVPLLINQLMMDKRISRAAHPVIHAWRCRAGNILHQDNDDDGETAAGGRLAHLLQILELENVLVVVTRYFGGIHLGTDRFKHINQAARNALELGGFLDAPDLSNTSKKPLARTSKKR